MRYHTRRRSLIALSSFAAYRGPALRDGTGDTGNANPGGGGNSSTGTGQVGNSGGSEQQGGQSGGQQQTGQSGTQQPSQSGTQQSDQAPGSGNDWKMEDLPPGLQKYIGELRGEAANSRTNAKQQAATEAQQELAQKIGKALGLVTDDEQPADPAQLTQQLTTMADSNKALSIELTVWRNAKDAEANPKALTDSRSFMEKALKLDPTADDFAAKIRAEMKKAVDENPQYRQAGQAPARSGGEFTGGPGGDAVTQEQFKRMSVAQRNELHQTNPTLYRKLAGR